MPAKKLLVILTAFVGYWLLGTFASIYVIPPGVASPIWPAAGFALFMVLLYGRTSVIGIAIGSFAVNIGISGASLLEPSHTWVSAITIAFGASLQTLAGYWLILRFTRYPELTQSINDPITFALLGGPLACLVSSFIGTASLVANNVIPQESTLPHWLYWWIGDTIGVFAMTPIILAANKKAEWSGKTKASSFILFYLGLVILVSILFIQTREEEENKLEVIFNEKVSGIHKAIEQELNSIEYKSTLMASLFSEFQPISYEQFIQFSQQVYFDNSNTQAITWIPFVHHNQRESFEQAMAEKLDRPYTFTEKNSAGKMVTASNQNTYYPVYYITPIRGNENALGYNLGSNQSRLTAINKAIRAKTIVSTEPLYLVKDYNGQLSFLLLTPIIKNDTVDSLISTVYRAEELLDGIIEQADLRQIFLVVEDVTDLNNPTIIYNNNVHGSDIFINQKARFGDRTWSISYSANNTFIHSHQGNTVWIVLIAGFFIVALFGLFVLLLMHQKSAVENEVHEKTDALRNALLEAKSANQTKNNFLANMSHELRTPLNSIIGFSVRSLKKLKDSENDQITEALNIIEENGRHLLLLINDILDLSKLEANKISINKTEIELQEVCNTVVKSLLPSAESKALTLSSEIPPIKSISADRIRLIQIITNLVSNGIKFTEQGGVSIKFELYSHNEVDGLNIKIIDTGTGISSDDIPKLFRRFEQLGENIDTQNIGTGLGLALVRELVELHQGTIEVESHIEVEAQTRTGSMFTVWLPRY